FSDFARTAAACAVMALAVWQVPAWGGLAELAGKASVGVVIFSLAAWVLDAAQVRSRAAQALKLLKVRPA
ncbi:MAG TPA: lipopolysaccharide biosynthesis protein, partial [Phenylobacterium sp.]|nr:lipopolysaccharide biosynthesis protein [Phenylobacterium sp.]